VCWGREEGGIQANLVKDSVRLWVLYNRAAFGPSKAACHPPGPEGGTGMPGFDKLRSAVRDVGAEGPWAVCGRSLGKEH